MGGKTSTTTQQVQIPKEVMDRYNAVNTRAEGLGDTPFKQYSTDPAAFVAQLNNQQLAGTNQINASAGAYQPYFAQAGEAMRAGMGSAQPGELNLGQFYNPYQQQVIDATMKQMGQANEQAQSGALGTAISSGAFGGDRAGIAAANLANQQGLAMGSTLAGLNAQNYNQALAAAQQQQGVQLGATQADLARLMQGGQFYAGLGQAAQQAGIQGGEAMLNAGTLGQQTEQAGLSALYNQFQQQQAYPFQIAQFLANIAMGTGALSGSTTATTQPGSFWSDRRLKRDIKRIGTSDNGLPVYTFKYKGDDTEQTHVGYMADEVEKKHPDAVGVAGNGYKYVDYDRASRAEGGGVAGPYGSPVGSESPYAAGYVPQAYLPVGELITADPALLQQARQSMAEQLAAAARLGESAKSLDGTWQWAKDRWGGEEREETQGEAEASRGVQRAYGGPAYLSAGVAGRQNPVEKSTYLSETLDSQGKRNDELMRPNSSPERRKSGLENVVDLGKLALGFMGMERGGVVGRHGYATDGAVETDEERLRRVLAAEAGSATNALPSGVVPQPDRISRPVSYNLPENRPDVEFRTPSGTRGSYDPDTGVMRDYAGNAVTGEAGDVFRNIATGAQEAERGALATGLANARLMQEQSPTSENTQGLKAAQDAYTTASSYPTAREARASYVPPSELAMREAGVSAPAVPVTDQGQGLGARLMSNEPPIYPEPGLAISTSQRPMPRPEGLGAAPVTEATQPGGVVPPMVMAPEVVTPAPADAASDPFGFAVGFTLQHEGGFNPSDANGAPVNRGINAAYHPEVDIENLTEEQARDIYRRDYWQPINGDRIAAEDGPEMARAVFDTAVMSGPDTALDLYRRSGGDPQSFLRMRADYLNDLALKNPEKYGKYVKAWNNRTLALGGPNMMTQYGEQGLQQPERSGLAAGLLTPEKRYEDRNTLGKVFYNEDGSLNRDALLSLASGVGGMLASPSQFFLPTVGAGLQNFASTYAGLEKQAADVGETKARTMETVNRAVAQAFFRAGQDGPIMVTLANGQPVTLDKYLSDPSLRVSTDPNVEREVREEAQRRQGSAPVSGAGGAVFNTPVVQGYIAGEATAANMNFTGAQERSATIEQGLENSAEAARASRASMLLQTDAVANLVSPDATVRSGALGELKVTAVRYANELLRAGGYEPITGADDAQIAQKAAIAASLDRASGGGQQSFEALNALLVANPNVQNEPEANAKLMATLMLAQQRAVDAAEFARSYKLDPNNGYRLVTDAPKAFDELYRRRYLAEEGALKTLILHGYETPSGWPKSPMEYLMDQSLSAADRNEVIRKTLLSYGYTEDQIAPLASAGGTLDMARYFGG